MTGVGPAGWSAPGTWPRDRPGSGSGRCVSCQVWSAPGLWPRDRPGVRDRCGLREWVDDSRRPGPGRTTAAHRSRTGQQPPLSQARDGGPRGEGPQCPPHPSVPQHTVGLSLAVPEAAEPVDPSARTAIEITETTARVIEPASSADAARRPSFTISPSHNVTRASSKQLAPDTFAAVTPELRTHSAMDAPAPTSVRRAHGRSTGGCRRRGCAARRWRRQPRPRMGAAATGTLRRLLSTSKDGGEGRLVNRLKDLQSVTGAVLRHRRSWGRLAVRRAVILRPPGSRSRPS